MVVLTSRHLNNIVADAVAAAERTSVHRMPKPCLLCSHRAEASTVKLGFVHIHGHPRDPTGPLQDTAGEHDQQGKQWMLPSIQAAATAVTQSRRVEWVGGGSWEPQRSQELSGS